MKKINENKGVFVIYTGGTIGSIPKDPTDPESPQVVVSWEKFRENTPDMEKIEFPLGVYETEPLDSCNIGPVEWKEMALAIRDNYDKYEGFVILHGTDTMVYTASALSFMLQNLSKPVVITGAQVPPFFVRNDALQNLFGAIQIANPRYYRIPLVPEVCIYFNNKLYRGNRCRKIDASGFEAYRSPNFPLLGEARESIVINELLVRKPDPNKVFTVKTRLEPNVIAVNVFPGIQDGYTLERALQDQNLKGVVLMAYGAGNVPTKKKVMELIDKATERGVIVLDVTQCGGGKVEMGLYETSAMLLDVGVVSGIDITPEAALCKLMVLLGDEDMTSVEVAKQAQVALAGEQSTSIYITTFKSTGSCMVDPGIEKYRIPAETFEGEWDSVEDIERILLRFRNAKVSNDTDAPVNIKFFYDISSGEPLDESRPTFLGSFNRIPQKKPTDPDAVIANILVFDITERAKKVLGNRASFTVALGSETGSFMWDQVELAIYVKEW